MLMSSASIVLYEVTHEWLLQKDEYQFYFLVCDILVVMNSLEVYLMLLNGQFG